MCERRRREYSATMSIKPSGEVAAIVTLPICCMCKRVSDDEDGSSPAVWTKLHTYLDRHHLRQTDFQLSHTYCPVCYSQQARAWHLPHMAPPLKRSA